MSDNTAPVFLVVGTRPEAIKMAPIYQELHKAHIPLYLCATMQHDQLSQDVFTLFGLQPNIELNIMRHGQDIFYVTHAVLLKIKEVMNQVKPCMVLVQGDTTSAMAAALAAFYLKIPIMHIEAGLRTHDLYAPFPEEMNRQFISLVATYHCAPTQLAVNNLLTQGIKKQNVFYTGNTIVDALRITQEKINAGTMALRSDLKQQIDTCRKKQQQIILLTMHRRESFDGGLLRILNAVKEFLQNNHNVICFYVYHPNPIIIHAMQQVALTDLPNIYLYEPLDYTHMIYLLHKTNLVVTDSGGIQEEAISLNKPVLVLRDKTERMEGVYAGLAYIVGTHKDSIQTMMQQSLQLSKTVVHHTSVYGDGYASEKIVSIIKNYGIKPIESTARHTMSSNDRMNPRAEISEFFGDKIKKDAAMKKVIILGLGYIGLPTAVIAADHGFDVVGVDIDAHKVNCINAGDPVIQEPAIYEKLHYVLGNGNFRATTIIESADYFIIAVPTPITEDKTADLHFVFDAAHMIASVITHGNTVILESTVPVGITEEVAHILEQKTQLQAGKDFFIAHCPERVLPGNIVQELTENDRIIGGNDQQSLDHAKSFYKTFVHGCLYLTNLKTAEMVKLIENSCRDTQLAFAHQVASMAYSIDLNPYEVIALANKHPRVNILQPTVGVGGHCIAIDPWFLTESFPAHSNFIKAARETNDAKPNEIITFINQAVSAWQSEHDNRICTVLLMGITYKPDVDDLRESPALHIVQNCIRNQRMKVLVCEPMVKTLTLKLHLKNTPLLSAMEGIAAADIIVFLVGHQRFKALDRKLFNDKKILDFCGVLYDEKKMTVHNEAIFWPAQTLSFSMTPHTEPYDQDQDR